jgi:ABC-2 type transport system ATP-binding protein
MCDSLVFIDQGRLVFEGAADALKHGELPGAVAATGTVVIVTVADDPRRLVEWAETNPGWKLLEERRDGARLEYAGVDGPALAEALRRLVAAGIPVVEFRREQRRLEEAFVEMVRGKGGRP